MKKEKEDKETENFLKDIETNKDKLSFETLQEKRFEKWISNKNGDMCPFLAFLFGQIFGKEQLNIIEATQYRKNHPISRITFNDWLNFLGELKLIKKNSAGAGYTNIEITERFKLLLKKYMNIIMNRVKNG